VVFFLCYYSAYVSYFFFPVEGPRLFLANLHTVKLVGIVFAEKIRNLIDFFEPNKLDCFPSLHSAILSVTMLVCHRHNRKMFWLFQPIAIGIMISLVYCRYHYVVDIVAGFVWAFPAFYGGIYLNNRLNKHFRFHFQLASK
jgi:membrane-associated phospholipid phosphatase